MHIIKPETTDTRFTSRDWLLISLTFATGAIDAISYFGLGKIFSAFMTGNLVFLGFGFAKAGGPQLIPVLCAVAFFSLGAYLGTRTTLHSPANGTWTALVIATMSAVVLCEAAFLVIWIGHDAAPGTNVTNVLISLLGLAMGLQMAAVRALGVPGVFTTAATFTLLAFFGDLAGSRPAAEGPRLAGTLFALILGAYFGGLLFIQAPLYAPALPLGVTILVIIAGLLMARESPKNGSPATP